MTNFQNQFPQLFLRLAISFTILSAVADRFGFWGDNSSWGNWGNFVIYTKQFGLGGLCCVVSNKNQEKFAWSVDEFLKNK